MTWKAIQNYPLYECSANGEIRNKETGKILKQYFDSKGRYKLISLCKDGKMKMLLVHRVIAMTFIENPNNLEQVNHIDGNKVNNSINNLEWMNRSDNIKHGYEHNLMKRSKGYCQERKIERVCSETGKVIVYKSITDALKDFPNLKHRTSISNFLNGRTKSAGGCTTWRYSNT